MQGCSALCLGEHRFVFSSGWQGKLFLEGWGCFSQWGYVLKTLVAVWEICTASPQLPSLFTSPPGLQFTPR